MYTHYVTRKYGEAVVVFDGYGCSSIKDMAHQRRVKGHTGVFTAETKLRMRKEHFLTKPTNSRLLRCLVAT